MAQRNRWIRWGISYLATACLSWGAQAATVIRESAFVYGTDGILKKEIIEPAKSELCQVTEYTFDTYGNRTGSTTRNCNGTTEGGVTEAAAPTGTLAYAAFTARSTTISYDAQGQFPTSTTNALSQTETRTYDAKTGAVLTLTGPNGLTTTWQYDDLGRKKLEIRADGNRTAWAYLYCSGVNGGTASCPAYAKYLVHETPQNSSGVANGPWVKTYYDELGRTIRSETVDSASRTIKQDTAYDTLGRVTGKSYPYSGTNTNYWTTYTYDDLDRPLSENSPGTMGTRVVTHEYTGLTVKTTNAEGKATTTTKNRQGQVVSVTDAYSKTISYTYDPYDNLIKTVDPLGNTTTLTYDVRGRKTQLKDPDMGTWTYQYNALGELIKQTDAKGQITTQAYDKLGRMISRSEVGLNSTWTYDSCTKGVGKLCQAQTDNGTQRSYAYDTLGRPTSSTTTLDTTYTASVTYDANGRIATRTYPTGFALKYTYSTLGLMTAVRNNATNALYWSIAAADVNDRGQLTKETYGNNVVSTYVYDTNTNWLRQVTAGVGTATTVQNLSYTYDKLGSLQSRQDTNQGLAETFGYDNLNRLITVATQGGGVTGVVTTTVTYDEIGNIKTKSGVGTYAYNASGATSVRPHAVASITGTLAATYTYDANGSMLTGAGRTVAYTGFNMPATITGNGTTLSFVYDDTHQRVKQIAPSGTVYYVHPDNVGGLFYEKEVKTGGVTEHKHYITASSGTVAIYTTRSTNVTTLRYLHKDHLGSTNAVSDETGAVVERLAYDAWGKRQFPNGTTDPGNTLAGVNTDRGFTGHEHLEEVGLVHMNGRIYDPRIGRFMSADPMIQAPYNPQSYNRYSYAFNSPLNGVDPSGYGLLSFIDDILDAVGDLIGSVAKGVSSIAESKVGRMGLSIGVGYMTGNWYLANFGGWSGASVAAGALGGFSGTMVATGGDFEASVKGAIVGAGFGWAGGLDGNLIYAGHAAVGCASGELQGGGCLRGAASAVAGKLVTIHTPEGWNDYQRFAAAVATGGTVSVIGGGQFANGAITAAYGYLFNQVMTKLQAEAAANARNNAVMRGECPAGFENNCAGLPRTTGTRDGVDALKTIGSATGAGAAIMFRNPEAATRLAVISLTTSAGVQYFEPNPGSSIVEAFSWGLTQYIETHFPATAPVNFVINETFKLTPTYRLMTDQVNKKLLSK
ncbi:RHS repeat-associated core domain-containing protein [Pigmentiphaga sp. CHJ604]|uniref:RHS repeat domain-containing protein n=1 Tax=Pigmentiphaga sp. CHJ604 TaxID=3081984 RepID=UPI0030CF1DB6